MKGRPSGRRFCLSFRARPQNAQGRKDLSGKADFPLRWIMRYGQWMTSLMLSRRFAPLFWCQFFSAFSDNFLKTALVFLILFQIGGPHADALITAAGGIFIAPFIFPLGLRRPDGRPL